jgi:hypothetical protein
MITVVMPLSRTHAAVLFHEIEPQQHGGLGIDRHRLERRRGRRFHARPLVNDIAGKGRKREHGDGSGGQRRNQIALPI